MRQIKFRAWNITHSYWTKPEEMMMAWGTFRHGDIEDGIAYDHSWVVEQFTGLLCKDGKEIFEGDIVGYGKNNTAWVVSWSEKYGKMMWGEMFVLSRASAKNLRVIGNIHQHPNLTDQKK